MHLDRYGEEYQYNDVVYHVGDQVYANSESVYEGLYGIITEICDRSDKTTENEGPDLCCCFDPPVLPDEIKEMEQRFSDLYQCPKQITDLGLDEVIMAPEMLDIIRPPFLKK